MNILIVDDDAVIRNWLSMLLRQLQELRGLHFHLSEAADGAEALDLCRSQPVDLVITDIKIPGITGIELINQLKQECPHIRTAVLSSYDDFDYVRIALKCGALDYILKAEMQMEDIAALLDKTLNDIRIEESVSAGPGAAEPDLEFSRLFTHFMQSEDALPDFLEQADPPLRPAALCIAVFRMRADAVLQEQQVAAICTGTMRGHLGSGAAIPWENGMYILFYNTASTIPERQEEEYIKLLSLLDKSLEKYTGTPIANSVNILCRKGDDLRARLREALDILDYRQYYAITATGAQVNLDAHYHSKTMVMELQKQLDMDQSQAAADVLREHLRTVHDMRLLPRRVRRLMITGVNVFLTNAALNDPKNTIAEKLDAIPSSIAGAHTEHHMTAAVGQFCTQYLELAELVQRSYSPAIQGAVDYIHQHYNQKLGLDDVAAHVYLNRSYLSMLFKKETGTSFGDYIEQVRITNAKHLIRAGDKSMADIAAYVGFSNQNYFTKVFKKVTGVSPMHYKKGGQ